MLEVCHTTAFLEREGLSADTSHWISMAARDPVLEAGSTQPQNAIVQALSPPSL